MAHIPNPILHTLRQSPPDQVETYLASLPAGTVVWQHFRTIQDPPPPPGYTFAKGDFLKGACGHWRRKGWGGSHSDSDCEDDEWLAARGVVEIPLGFISQEALF